MSFDDSYMKICCLRDYDPLHPRDSTGFNKVGYITSTGMVIFPVLRHYTAVPLTKFRGKTLELSTIAVTEEQMLQIDSFFTGNVLNPTLLQRAFNAICRGELNFFDEPIKLPKLTVITPTEHEERWNAALKLIKVCDLVQVFDEKSIVSQLIVKVDRGCWSHSACYAGNGKVIEAITSGVTERSIEVYKKPSTRVGIYRIEGMDLQKSEAVIDYARSQLGSAYGWFQALRVGAERIFSYDPARKPKTPTPNELIVWSDTVKLVAVV